MEYAFTRRNRGTEHISRSAGSVTGLQKHMRLLVQATFCRWVRITKKLLPRVAGVDDRGWNDSSTIMLISSAFKPGCVSACRDDTLQRSLIEDSN